MALHLHQEHQGAQLLVWKIEETEEMLLSLLDDTHYHQEKLNSFKQPKRRLEYLATRILLHLVDPSFPTSVYYLPSGRPFLKDRVGEISLSHTAGYAALYYHPSLGVGVDIEQRSDKAQRLKTRYLHENEIASVDAITTDWQSASLLAWSAKESLFKLIGCSDVDFREHLHLSFTEPLARCGCFAATELRTPQQGEYTICYLQEDDFVLTYILKEE